MSFKRQILKKIIVIFLLVAMLMSQFSTVIYAVSEEIKELTTDTEITLILSEESLELLDGTDVSVLLSEDEETLDTIIEVVSKSYSDYNTVILNKTVIDGEKVENGIKITTNNEELISLSNLTEEEQEEKITVIFETEEETTEEETTEVELEATDEIEITEDNIQEVEIGDETYTAIVDDEYGIMLLDIAEETVTQGDTIEIGVIAGTLATYGHELHYMTYNGETVLMFCIQYSVTSPNGTFTIGQDVAIGFPSSDKGYMDLAMLIYMGYTRKWGTGLPTTTEAWRDACYMQEYVWEYLGNSPGIDTWKGFDTSAEAFTKFFTEEVNDYFYYYYNYPNPSFDGNTVELEVVRNGSSSITVTDSTIALEYYPTFSVTKDGLTFSHTWGSNQLVITVTDTSSTIPQYVTFNSNDYDIHKCLKDGTTVTSQTYYATLAHFDTWQDVYMSNYLPLLSFSITVEVKYGKIEITKQEEGSSALSGVKFGLYADSSCTDEVATGTTNSNGYLEFNYLPYGTYYLKELDVPSGYLLSDEVKTININSNTAYTLTITNYEPTGSLSLEKTDSETGNDDRVDGTSHHGDATLSGTVYTLYANESIDNLANTIHYYDKDEAVATFTFDEYGVATVQIINKGNAKLEINGSTLEGIPLGEYYLVETTVPEGYLADEETHYYTFSFKDKYTEVIEVTDTLENTVQKAPFEVIKFTTNDNSVSEALEGAEFTAILTKYVDFYGSFEEALKHLDEYADDEYSVFTTGSNGHGISGRLAYGTYTVNETYTPLDTVEPVKEFTVTIDSDSEDPIYEFLLNDLPFSSYLILQKQDKDSGKFVTYSNTTFKLYKLNEETSEWEEVQCKIGDTYYNTWTTNDEGIAKTETKLDYGTYKLTEVVVPEGYLDLDEDIIFEINKIHDTIEYDDDFDAWITITAENEQPTGTLNISKSVNFRDYVDYSLIADGIDFTDIEFVLYAKEDIIDYADGSNFYDAGDEVARFNLSEDGTYTLEGLHMGSYILKEVTTADGLVLSSEEYEVTFTKQDNTTKVYTLDLSLENDTTYFEITKTDITGEVEVEGATLSILDDDGNTVDTWVSTSEPHKIEGLVAGMTYTLREEIAVDGYVKATDVEFTVENTKDTQKVTMIDKRVSVTKTDITGEVEIEGAELTVYDTEGNVVDSWVSSTELHYISGLVEGETYVLVETLTPDEYVTATSIEFTVSYEKIDEHIQMEDKQVSVTKTDITGEVEVEGAELTVYDTEGNVVDSWISTSEPHYISGLVEGETYTLVETLTPDEYVTATSIEFTVSYEKINEHIQMEDKQVSVSKIDITGSGEIEGAELTVYDTEGNVVDSWISTSEPHYISGLVEGETYVLVETLTPDGYMTAESIEFTVSYEKINEHIEMEDRFVAILKTDLNGEELTGAELTVYDEEGNIVDTWTVGNKIIDLTEDEILDLENGSTLEGTTTVTIEKQIEEDLPTDDEEIIEDEATEETTEEEATETEEEILVEEVEATYTITPMDEYYKLKLEYEGKTAYYYINSDGTEYYHLVRNLEENSSYTLVETLTPDEYVTATSIEFTTDESSFITMVDKQVAISKQDIAGEEIEGAELTVYDTEGNVIDSWISTTEPHYVTGLVEGETYILVETLTPSGYVTSEAIEFTVSYEKEMEHIEMVDKRVTVNKIDEDGNSLSGAEFAVFDEDGNLVDTWVSDGTLHYVSGLLEGKTYRLVELTTPSGYYPSETIEFTVTYDKETQNIEVVNYRTEVASQALSKLPQTGF